MFCGNAGVYGKKIIEGWNFRYGMLNREYDNVYVCVSDSCLQAYNNDVVETNEYEKNIIFNSYSFNK